MLMLDWNHKLKEDGVKVGYLALTCTILLLTRCIRYGPGFLLTSRGRMPEMMETAKKMGAGHPSAEG